MTLTRRRIYILPTGHGIAFVGGLAVMLVGAMNYANSLAYLLTFVLTGIGLVSILHTYRNLAGLALEIDAPRPVFAGEQAHFCLAIDNLGGRQRPALLVRHPDALPPRPGARRGRWRRRSARHRALAVIITEAPAGGIGVARIGVLAAARGEHRLERVVLATRYPLGLFRAWSPVDLEARLLVYPKPEGARELPEVSAGSPRDGGRSAGGRDDFSGLRDYRPGDSPRRIHWKAAARGQGTPVKLFDGASTGDVELEWDATAALGDAERRLSQLCLWVTEAERLGLRYTLSLPGERVEAGSGEGHRSRCLERLATFRPGSAGTEVGP